MGSEWWSEVAGIPVVPPPDPTPGLARLGELVALVGGAGSAQTGVDAVADLLQDESAMAAVLAAFRARPDAVDAILLRIGQKRGLRDPVNRLRASLRARAKDAAHRDREATLRLVPPSAPCPTCAEVLGWDGIPVALRPSEEWELRPDGVNRLQRDPWTGLVSTTPVTSRALIVTGRLKDIEDQTTLLRLEWGGEAREGFRIVLRGVLADTRRIVGLADYNAPINSENAHLVVEYIAAFEDSNRADIPEALVASRLGWIGQGREPGFLWGHNQIIKGGAVAGGLAIEDVAPSQWNSDQVHLKAEAGFEKMAAAFRASGTWEGWQEIASLAAPYPSVYLAIYASLVPPLIPLIPGLPNFVIDWSGTTSMGKTTTLRLGASTWGSPDERDDGLLRSWDATRVWLEQTSGFLSCLPLFLDDTKRARKAEIVGQFLYDLANGSGRGRGAVTGTRASMNWHVVLLSTGEAPVVSFTQDGGTRARTLCIWGAPFGGADENTAAVVARINAGVMAHYGHAGPRMVQWLLSDPAALDIVRRGYTEGLATWTRSARGNPVAGRAASYIAALATAANILHLALGVPRPSCNPLDVAWRAVCESSAQADRATEALRDVRSWATSQQGKFDGRAEGVTTDIDEPIEWLGAWPEQDAWGHIAFLTDKLRGFLAGRGYDTEAIFKTWHDRGWLHCEGVGHRTRKMRVGKRQERCIVVLRAAFDLLEEVPDV